ncbi:MAG: response regulator [Marinobacterium sp.]|nr:response regulator [Marinobacterium sp.]
MDLNDLLVIVIEPSNVQRTIIIDRLRDHGIEKIEEFTDASTALGAIRSLQPDIVVSSMHLPDMTGTELVGQMREDEDLAAITFLLISSETHYRYLEPVRQAGAIGILPKPFSSDELTVALRSTLHYLTESSNPPHVPEENAHIRVLVVDDSRMSRRFVQQMLENLGVTNIIEAVDGAQALALLQDEETFDLVITDYNMPNVDGKELTEHIRQGDRHPNVPILMITSEQNEQQLAAIQRAGVSAVVNKPLSYDMVKTLIERLVHEL